MSDIVEIYDGKCSRFFYCDSFGFKRIRFKPVKLLYMLLSCAERDIFNPQFFNSFEEAQTEMRKEIRKQTGNSDDYKQDEDFGLDDDSAWSDVRYNSDWRIITLSLSYSPRNVELQISPFKEF